MSKRFKKRIVLGTGFSSDKWKWNFLKDVETGKVAGQMFKIPLMFDGKRKYRVTLILERVTNGGKRK